MKKLWSTRLALILTGTFFFLTAYYGCNLDASQRKPMMTLFIGLDSSGSFTKGRYYEDSLQFIARYIYGHLNELGGLAKPRELFVASIGGMALNDPKTFHPIHDFEGKNVTEIEEDLKRWFPPNDPITDFNTFFEKAARLAKERNLTLTPITLLIVSDGIPDIPVPNAKAKPDMLYEKINLDPLEYLARNVTVRLVYPSPKVAENWRKFVPRSRVRLLTVEADVMTGWQRQFQPEVELPKQNRLWKWVEDTVDLRVRSNKI
ncbi:MAG: hypothetical protein ACHQYP_10070 [Nitrospiria bacterium]